MYCRSIHLYTHSYVYSTPSREDLVRNPILQQTDRQTDTRPPHHRLPISNLITYAAKVYVCKKKSSGFFLFFFFFPFWVFGTGKKKSPQKNRNHTFKGAPASAHPSSSSMKHVVVAVAVVVVLVIVEEAEEKRTPVKRRLSSSPRPCLVC
ncbi:hypothetical protein B0T19DRAFT_254110 [Cercophora scortea]|uniref:Uncharacterized protein n=1 Tax=Cercophora scortea TaxID=314031 RepID=A0AAE0I9H7_9PEZI|nr:hypothetical protein B0T19DRAFT_254110 [Cercophora scortea]